jgi:hypothetical protein
MMMMIIIMIMSIGRDYVSELLIYEHGKPQWNDIERGKLLIPPPELSGNPTSSHLVAISRNGRKE